MAVRPTYIVSARRLANGRIGGIHRQRRVEELCGPVISAALKDCGLSPARVEGLILGNVAAGGNPARIVALAAGLPESCPALTIDQQCISGLAAILSGLRTISTGEAEIIVAGGVEALSMAPWRVAKPRHLHQTPRFIGLDSDDTGHGDRPAIVEASDAMAAQLKISRMQQDDFALRTHMRASLARDARRFVKEIVAIRPVADEARDQSAVEPDLAALQAMPSLEEEGTLTAGNTTAWHDGAAAIVAVSEAVWTELGKPPALRFVASATIGVSASEEVDAPMVAMRRLLSRAKGLDAKTIDVIELNETSAAQAIAFRNILGLADDSLNPDGGTIARGHPMGAAGAVLVVRLFTRMARATKAERAKFGVAVLGARGGQGTAALFETV